MKRIYLLLALVALVSNSFAQRHPDLTIQHRYAVSPGSPVFYQDYKHITVDGDEGIKYNFTWNIINHGTTANDTVAVSDTIYIKSPWGTTYRGALTPSSTDPIGGMRKDDTAYLSPTSGAFALVPSSTVTESNTDTVNWCDSVYIGNAPGSPNPVQETMTSNNKICNIMILDTWLTGVKDIKIEGSGIYIFPNPATGRLNFKYDFGNNKNATVSVVDVIGKTIYQSELKGLSGMQNIPVEVSSFASGTYILKIVSGDKVATERFYVK